MNTTRGCDSERRGRDGSGLVVRRRSATSIGERVIAWTGTEEFRSTWRIAANRRLTGDAGGRKMVVSSDEKDEKGLAFLYFFSRL